MREKYVDEAFPFWMEFGIHANGNVDVVLAGAGDEVLTNVTKENAARAIEAQGRLQQAFVRLTLAFHKAAPEAFKDLWYGGDNPLHSHQFK